MNFFSQYAIIRTKKKINDRNERMTKDKKTQKLLLAHAKRYPKLQAQDLFKFIFQSSFGCEHLLASPERAIGYIQAEYEQNSSAP